uniref:Uncharacterized protein n=1 Tax=Cacopsylla melanoneura TaxID=428564 RepID=A0A8D8UBX7_9HEMI
MARSYIYFYGKLHRNTWYYHAYTHTHTHTPPPLPSLCSSVPGHQGLSPDIHTDSPKGHPHSRTARKSPRPHNLAGCLMNRKLGWAWKILEQHATSIPHSRHCSTFLHFTTCLSMIPSTSCVKMSVLFVPCARL